MTVVEIILLIVGMLFILASFWVTEKLSPEELEHISELSKEEMGVMLRHELDRSKQKVVDMVEDTIDASKEQTERSLEKQTNEKIMAINEYSDTVFEKMNKTHNEIMFLYSMLNDKHSELTSFSSDLAQKLQDFKQQEEEMTKQYLTQLKNQQPQADGALKADSGKPQAAAAKTKTAAKTRAKAKTAAKAASDKKPQDKEKTIEPIFVYEPQGQEVVPVESQAAPAGVDGRKTKKAAIAKAQKVPEAPEEEVNVKEEIIRLYEEGKDSVAIAKKLGVGVGEVRLILGLYKGDS